MQKWQNLNKFPKPHIHTSTSQSMENSFNGESLPKIKMINYDSEIRRMIPQLSYSLNRLKRESFSTKFNEKRNNVSIIKEIMRFKEKYEEPYSWNNFSIDNKGISMLQDGKEGVLKNKTRNSSEEMLILKDNSQLNNSYDPEIQRVGSKSTLRKAMNYFINQKMKGNSPIDYTSFFILNNDKYIGKLTSL